MEQANPKPKRPREGENPHPSRKRQTLSRGQVKNYKAHLGIPSRRAIDGPGIWAMVVKGKEKQAAGELYNIVETISNQLWPKSPTAEVDGADDVPEPSDEGEDIEKQLARELSDINKPKSKAPAERRIGLFQVPDVDTFLTPETSKLPYGYYLWALVRLIPASGICAANMPAITTLASGLFASVFGGDPKKYKIELRIRNHAVLTKEEVIKEIAKCVPADKGHTVSLTNQDTTILVEVFKAVCTMAVVPDYDKYKRFNVAEIVKDKHKGTPATDDSRVVLPATTS
ncbi:hypothetical protein FRC08_009808 [Ceratobasidium sp. 394]|nr:hypothetical protein FRC08_009808 [Ceratobasidium sp. 394]